MSTCKLLDDKGLLFHFFLGSTECLVLKNALNKGKEGEGTWLWLENLCQPKSTGIRPVKFAQGEPGSPRSPESLPQKDSSGLQIQIQQEFALLILSSFPCFCFDF